MNSILRTGWLTLSALLLLVAAPVAGSSVDDRTEVKAAVQGSIDEILGTLTNEKLTRRERREEVKQVIERMVDLELLAKLSLGRTHWGQIDDAQRKEFTELFVETIRQSTYEKLELFTDEKVDVGEPEELESSKSPKFRVVTGILSKGDRIELALFLAKRGKEWRVYDLEIEGVSIRKSYSSQYADFLQVKTFDELIAEMRRKIDESKKKMAELDAQDEQPN